MIFGRPSLSAGATEASPVGAYGITVGLGNLSATNYSFAFVDGTLTVGKAVIVVTADSTNRIYGDINPAFTASYSDFVEGDDQTVIRGVPSLTTAGGTNSSIGAYSIVAAIGSLAADR